MKFWGVFFVLWLMVIPSMAQSGSKALTKDGLIEIGGGYQIALPESWAEAEADAEILYPVDDRFGAVVLEDTQFNTQAVIISPAALADTFTGEAVLSLEDAYILAVAEVYGVEVTLSDIELEPAGLTNYDGVVQKYVNTIDATQVVFGGTYLIKVDESGSFLLADVYSKGDDFGDENERVVALLDAIIAPESVTAPVASGDPCLVSTDTARSATVRVGPGTNRTALLFLPVGDGFSVTGRFVATDETVWYQLDKTQVDPNTSAAELWVAQADITEAGDCASVGETSAPPIRPIVSAPPAGGGTSGGGGSAPAASLPQNGTWTMTLASRGLVSCLGTNTIEFNTSEVYGSFTSDTYALSADSSSNTFVMGGQLFTQLPSGAFTGALSFNNGSVGINFYVQNAGFMSGELVYNETIQGLACSFTIPLSASRG